MFKNFLVSHNEDKAANSPYEGNGCKQRFLVLKENGMSDGMTMGQETDRHKDARLYMDYQQWLTVRQFCSAFPWPSEAGLRAMIYGAFIGKNAFRSAFSKVGRRVLVSPTKLFKVIDELNGCSPLSVHISSNASKGGRL